MSVLEAENIGKRFLLNNKPHFHLINSQKDENYLWALKDINFKIEQGDFLAITGENGAGKTTLLRIISKIVHPTMGTVKANAKVTPLLDLTIEMKGYLTVIENIYLYGTIIGMTSDEIKEKVNNIIKFAELEQFVATKLRNLSYGMRARLAFSIGMAAETQILLIDEILSIGDSRFIHKCLQTIKKFNQENKTVILTTAWPTFIRDICNKTLWLNKGQMTFFGKTEDAFKEVNIAKAEFITELNL